MKSIYLILTILLSFGVVAYAPSSLDDLAEGINKFSIESQRIYLIQDSIEVLIWYEFNWFPKGINETWLSGKGDCTDTAMLKKYLADKCNITSRLVYGYIIINGGYIKHDWIEFKRYNKWFTFEKNVKKIGEGVW